MDVKELREQDEIKLNEELISLLKEHFELRMQKSTSQLSDLSKLKKTKNLLLKLKQLLKRSSHE